MLLRNLSLAVCLCAATFPSPARAQASGCSGTISGAIQAKFSCTVSVDRRPDGKTVSFVVSPAEPIAGVRSFEPASFQIEEPLSVRTYRLEALGRARSHLETSGGQVFSATGSRKKRGELELSLEVVERERSAIGGYTVAGKLHAHLVAAGRAAQGLDIDVSF